MTAPEPGLNQTLRLIDANLNRIGEGLRFLEDVCRLLLNDAALTQQLKTMRHEMVRADIDFNRKLLQNREAASDVGTDLEVPGEGKQRDLSSAVVANSRRVQESLRVLEEIAKLPGSRLDSEKYKQARFALYTIEKGVLAKLWRRDRTSRLRGLYVVIDTQSLRGRSHVGVAEQAVRGGAKVIQLRDKTMTKKQLLPVAMELKELCTRHNVIFIINDELDLALAVDADGLHLGQDDLPAKVTRQLLPVCKILGISVTTVEQAVAAEAEGADYLGAGAIYPTASKEQVEVVGLDVLRRMRKAVNIPIVAIGGINIDNAAGTMAAGADAVAVISAVLGAEDVAAACRKIISRIEVLK